MRRKRLLIPKRDRLGKSCDSIEVRVGVQTPRKEDVENSSYAENKKKKKRF